MSQTLPAATLTARFAEAVGYASAIHADQVRKGTAVTYTAHLLGVASLVLEAGGDEELAIAGLLHDAVEDCGGLPRAEEIRSRFGDRVATVVLGCSDSTDEEWKRGTPYWDRKQAYLDHLSTADHDVLLVSLADKVHNARSIATDLQDRGTAALAKFKATPGQTLRYYRECLAIGRRHNVPDALVLPLSAAVALIEEHLRTRQSAVDALAGRLRRRLGGGGFFRVEFGPVYVQVLDVSDDEARGLLVELPAEQHLPATRRITPEHERRLRQLGFSPPEPPALANWYLGVGFARERDGAPLQEAIDLLADVVVTLLSEVYEVPEDEQAERFAGRRSRLPR